MSGLASLPYANVEHGSRHARDGAIKNNKSDGNPSTSDGASVNGKSGGNPSTNAEDGVIKNNKSDGNPSTSNYKRYEQYKNSVPTCQPANQPANKPAVMLITNLTNRNDMAKLARKMGKYWENLVPPFFSPEEVKDFYSFDVGDGDAVSMFLCGLPDRKPELTRAEFSKICKEHGCFSLKFLDNETDKDKKTDKDSSEDLTPTDLFVDLTSQELEKIRKVIADTRSADPFWPKIASDLDYDNDEITFIENKAQSNVGPVNELLARLKRTYPSLPVSEIVSVCREKHLNDAASFLDELIQKFENSNLKNKATQ